MSLQESQNQNEIEEESDGDGTEEDEAKSMSDDSDSSEHLSSTSNQTKEEENDNSAEDASNIPQPIQEMDCGLRFHLDAFAKGEREELEMEPVALSDKVKDDTNSSHEQSDGDDEEEEEKSNGVQITRPHEDLRKWEFQASSDEEDFPMEICDPLGVLGSSPSCISSPVRPSLYPLKKRSKTSLNMPIGDHQVSHEI